MNTIIRSLTLMGVPSGRMCSPCAVAEVMLAIANAPQEIFIALPLNKAAHCVVPPMIIYIGHEDGAEVEPRVVFKRLLKCDRATAVVFVHNHPSGDPSPSLWDLELTGRLVEAGKGLGIEVRDHIVIAEQGYRSIMTVSCSREQRQPQFSSLLKAMRPVIKNIRL